MDPQETFDIVRAEWDRITEIRVLVGEFSIRIDDSDMAIGVRIYFNPDVTQPYWFETSHFIKTPTQGNAYVTSKPFEATPEAAIRRAVNGIKMFYDEAVDAGHTPDETWFIPNPRW